MYWLHSTPASIDTHRYLSATTGKVSTENFYWMSRMIAAMADASYSKSVFHIERYQESIAAKSHELLNRYDTLLEQETDEETRKNTGRGQRKDCRDASV